MRFHAFFTEILSWIRNKFYGMKQSVIGEPVESAAIGGDLERFERLNAAFGKFVYVMVGYLGGLGALGALAAMPYGAYLALIVWVGFAVYSGSLAVDVARLDGSSKAAGAVFGFICPFVPLLPLFYLANVHRRLSAVAKQDFGVKPSLTGIPVLEQQRVRFEIDASLRGQAPAFSRMKVMDFGGLDAPLSDGPPPVI